MIDWFVVVFLLVAVNGVWGFFYKRLQLKKPVHIIRLDREYADISYDELHASIERAHSIMNSEGWSYIPRALDCEDFAMKMKVEAVKFLAENCGQDNVGMPIHIFAYTRTDGARHAIIYGVADGKRWYFEPYPNSKWLTPKKLTKKEVESCTLDLA